MPKAWSSNWSAGAKYEDKPYTRKYVTSSSTSTSYLAARHTTAWAQRAYPSSNPVSHLGAMPWRDQSNYSRTVMETELTPCNLTQTLASGNKYVYEGFYPRTDDIRPDILTYPVTSNYGCSELNEQNSAVTRCLQKLKEDKVNVGTFLAESVRSADMVASSATKLFTLLLAVKRGQLTKVTKQSFGLDSANAYLQYRYGWKPLCTDLYDMYNQFESSTVRGPQLLSAYKASKNEYSATQDTSYWVNRQQEVTVKGQCKLFARLSDGFIDSLTSMGLTNPASLAWELVPYSFVVDWALPIGNFLEAASATAGLTFVGGFKGLRMEGYASGSPKSSWKGSPLVAKYSFLHYTRTELNAFPSPVLYVKSPFKTKNVLAALALHRQLR